MRAVAAEGAVGLEQAGAGAMGSGQGSNEAQHTRADRGSDTARDARSHSARRTNSVPKGRRKIRGGACTDADGHEARGTSSTRQIKQGMV